MSKTRLLLAGVFLGGAALVMLGWSIPPFLEGAATANPNWRPLLLDAFILLGFVMLVTGLAARYRFAETAFVAIVIYAALGIFVRLMSSATTGERVELGPDRLLYLALTWPSYLAAYVAPLR